MKLNKLKNEFIINMFSNNIIIQKINLKNLIILLKFKIFKLISYIILIIFIMYNFIRLFLLFNKLTYINYIYNFKILEIEINLDYIYNIHYIIKIIINNFEIITSLIIFIIITTIIIILNIGLPFFYFFNKNIKSNYENYFSQDLKKLILNINFKYFIKIIFILKNIIFISFYLPFLNFLYFNIILIIENFNFLNFNFKNFKNLNIYCYNNSISENIFSNKNNNLDKDIQNKLFENRSRSNSLSSIKSTSSLDSDISNSSNISSKSFLNKDINFDNYNNLSFDEKNNFLKKKFYNKGLDESINPSMLNYMNSTLLKNTDGSKEEINNYLDKNLNIMQKNTYETKLIQHSFVRVKPFLKNIKYPLNYPYVIPMDTKSNEWTIDQF
jgi:hypothetical protein